MRRKRKEGEWLFHRVEEEGWSYHVEEEGGGERGGPTVWRRREGRLFSICEITTCSEVPPLDFKSSVVYLMCFALDY